MTRLKHPGVGLGWAWLGDGSEPEEDRVITKAPRQHVTKDCWYKGGGSAHKAPKWFKELQARRKCKKEDTAQANVAQELKATPELANITAEHCL